MTRDDKGRFIKGVSGNPKGRSPKDREERYYDILLTAVTFDDWQAIVKKAAEQARRGDPVARKWLSDYLVGPVQQRIDVTTKDESLNAITIKGVDYRTAITNLAPRSVGNSDTPGEGQDIDDGAAVG